jgi:predicted glycoside hydrolase/deacetylase ChbG (UPF0249 family)
LCEWIVSDGCWSLLYQVVPLDDAPAVRSEVWRQVEQFRDLMGNDPTHLDSHQHAHHEELVREVVLDVAEKLTIPVRALRGGVVYRGDFYGQDPGGRPAPERLTVEFLIELIGGLPEGTTELACHPAVVQDVRSMYAAEREQEVQVLCDRRVRAALGAADVELVSQRDVRSRCAELHDG